MLIHTVVKGICASANKTDLAGIRTDSQINNSELLYITPTEYPRLQQTCMQRPASTVINFGDRTGGDVSAIYGCGEQMFPYKNRLINLNSINAGKRGTV